MKRFYFRLLLVLGLIHLRLPITTKIKKEVEKAENQVAELCISGNHEKLDISVNNKVIVTATLEQLVKELRVMGHIFSGGVFLARHSFHETYAAIQRKAEMMNEMKNGGVTQSLMQLLSGMIEA